MAYSDREHPGLYTVSMPSATYPQQNPFASGSHYGGMGVQPKFELYNVNLATWDDGYWSHPIFSERQPDELDQPWPFRFNSGQNVWVRASDSEWYLGIVVGRAKKGMTRLNEGLYWWIEFYMERCKVRKWFAPLNGDIKPDNEHTQWLLSNADWLEYDSDE